MAKSAYRGQDVTRELIREEFHKGKSTILSGQDAYTWNDACNKLAKQMKAEGLSNTAEKVLGYKVEV
jgi:pyruvate-formate lyase-activating enzyme